MSTPDMPWYQRTTVYQIYPRSFSDSNADGIGDIPGLIAKLDHIRDLGFETLWCSPFFRSPQRDFGYDISDYLDIAPEYGTREDAMQLIEAAHGRGMHIIFDMVMNHTSDQHPWFLESRSSRDNSKADWYIWRDHPNNWQSFTRRTGWHYAPERGQYYWASFLPFQPDLNYRSPTLKRAMFDVVRFWLGKGVDGFRLDMFNSIYKHTDFPDNPFAFSMFPSESNPAGFFQAARYHLNQPENYEFARELRALADKFGEKMLLGEVSGSRSLIRRFMGEQVNDGLTHVFDFSMLNFKFTASYFRELIGDVEAHFPSPFMPVYVFSNHDSRRSIRRLGNDPSKAKLLDLLQLTVRGVPCMYYGEELGMTDGQIPRERALDPIPHAFRFVPDFLFNMRGITLNRDNARTPMQWDGSKNAGFSTAAETWLPVNSDYRAINVAEEAAQPSSLLNTVRELLRIRRAEPALHSGSLELLDGLPADVLGYSRKSGGNELAVFINFSEAPTKVASRGGRWSVVFKLKEADAFEQGAVILGRFGGLILKRNTLDIQHTLEKARQRTS